MKKRITLISSLFLCCITLVACGSQGSGQSAGEDPSKLSHFEQAIASVSNYDIHLTGGFDYSIKQYYSSEVVNSKSVQLRVKFDGGTQAKRIQNTKTLNPYGQGEQFTTVETTTYFRNNQICEYDGGWKWRSYDESEYLKTGLSAYIFNNDYFDNVSEAKQGTDLQFTAVVSDNYVKNVLGSDATGITQLKIKLVVKNDYSLMKSLSFTYNQEKTNSEISFVSVFDAGTFDFPD